MISHFFIPLRPSYALQVLISCLASICIYYEHVTFGIILCFISIITHCEQKIFHFTYKNIALLTTVGLSCFMWTKFTNTTYQQRKKFAETIQNQKCSGIAVDSFTDEKENATIIFYVRAIRDAQNKWHQASACLSVTSKKEVPIGIPIQVMCSVHKGASSPLSQIMQKKSIHGYGRIFLIDKEQKKYSRNMFYYLFEHFTQFVHFKKKEIVENINLLCPSAQSFFKTIFLGNTNKSLKNNQKNTELRPLFEMWGIAHYLARSGLHVMLIISCIMFFMGFFEFSYSKSMYAGSFILGIFSIFSWSTLTFLRALTTWFLLVFSRHIKQSGHSLHIFCLCTFFFIIYNHSFIFSLDFQLSFGATFLLVWIFHTEKIRASSPVL